MPLRLVTRNGHHYLSPPEVVRCLKSTFAYVETDEEDGRRHVRRIIQQLKQIGQHGNIPVDNAHLERLRGAQDGAIYVYFADDPGSESSCLSVAVIPGEPLFFDYSSHADEQAAWDLIVRCAAALDYEVVDT